MRGKMTRTTTLSVTTALAGVLLLAGTTPALAQATWSLQPGADSTQAPARPSGPVDAQNPVVTRPGNTPEETPSPKVTLPAAPPPAVTTPAAKAPEKPAPKPSAPASEAVRRADAPAPRAAATQAASAPAPTEAPPARATQPEPSASPIAPAPSPGTADTSQTEPAAIPAPEAATAPASHWPEWWLAIPIALLLAAGGVFALLRRRAAPATAWEEAGMEPEPEAGDMAEVPETVVASAPKAPTEPVIAPPAQPATAPVTTAPAATAPPPRANPLVAPLLVPAQAPAATAQAAPVAVAVAVAAPAAAEKAEVVLETVLMRQSLVYATLVYRITLAAPTSGIPEGAVIAADMISAHASLSQAEQLAPDPASVPVRHRFDTLSPGETREVKGEIQLALNAVRPLRQGNAMLFVPLLRLFLALPDGSIERRVFSLGLPGEGAGLAPVRIDTGPRDHAPIQAREITGARSYAGPHPSGDVPQAAE